MTSNWLIGVATLEPNDRATPSRAAYKASLDVRHKYQSERRAQVIELIRGGFSGSNVEMGKILGVCHSSICGDVKSLLAAGVIRRIIIEKPSNWNIKNYEVIEEANHDADI